jgi:hypothetical protein
VGRTLPLGSDATNAVDSAKPSSDKQRARSAIRLEPSLKPNTISKSSRSAAAAGAAAEDAEFGTVRVVEWDGAARGGEGRAQFEALVVWQ